MTLLLDTICLVVAWFITIGIFTLIFDGTDGFKRNK
jgi:hypothetical protein